MAMLSGMMFALVVFSASSFELVSQTFNGTLNSSTTIPGLPSPPTPSLATSYFALDVDRCSMRQDTHITVESPISPGASVKIETVSSKIFDAATKRMTFFQITTTQMPDTPAANTTSCAFTEFPGLVAQADIKKCVADVVALAKPVSSEGGLLRFEFAVLVANATSTMDVYMDATFVVKKLVSDMDITSPREIHTHAEMVDMGSKAGAPGSGSFRIPAEWGTCTKTDTPVMPPAQSPVLERLYKCMGMQATAAIIV